MLLNIYEHSYSIIILKIRYRYSCYILFACLLQQLLLFDSKRITFSMCTELIILLKISFVN